MAGTIRTSSIQLDTDNTLEVVQKNGDLMLTINTTSVSFPSGGQYPLQLGHLPILGSNTFDTGTSQTWTKPANASFVKIELWGGGYSGVSLGGDSGLTGGRGGNYNEITVLFSSLQGDVVFTVGAGAVGYAIGVTGPSLPGGESSVTLVSFNEGSNLTISTANSSLSVYDYLGGSSSESVFYGGAGGSNNNSLPGTSILGGNGGIQPAGNGVTPGGGGGFGDEDEGSGSGGSGRVKFTWY